MKKLLQFFAIIATTGIFGTTLTAYDLQGVDDNIDGVEHNLMGVDDNDLGAVFNNRLVKRGLPPMSPAQTKAAVGVTKQIAVKSIEKANKDNTYTRAQRFMNAKMLSLDEESKKEIIKGNLQNQDTVFYLRREILAGAGAIVPLLESSNVRQCGVTNFDKNYLPDLMNFVLNKVRMGYSLAPAAARNAGDVVYTNSFAPGAVGSIPPAILNGEIEIEQNGAPILHFPVSQFFNIAPGAMNSSVGGFSDTVFIESLKLIKSKEPIGINLRLADGITLPAGRHMIEVRMTGVSTRRRGVNQ